MIHDALIITRREIRDSLRDWRIIAPILILTLIFPWIMNVSTRLAINFVEEYNATIIPLRLIPFALMIVGFFPLSFSLIIALESLVGEKERNSLEPLLSSPISDSSLYLGKLLSSMIPPLCASYLGITTYLAGLYYSIQYVPEITVLVQILVLTTLEALVMVAGAVVISCHTTSVRAANLLASFIIIPMSFLLQGESVLLFWGNYDVLWSIIAALIVATILLVRTGMQSFSREEILGREIDEINLRAMIRSFVSHFVGKAGFSLIRVYRDDVPRLMRENRWAIATTAFIVVTGIVFGWVFALQFPLPSGLIDLKIDRAAFEQQINMPGLGILPRIDTLAIFWNNVRSLALGALLGMVSFGSLGLLLLLTPMAIVGFFAGAVSSLGSNPLTFFAAFILPHGILEIPAAIIAAAFGLRWGASIIAPPPGSSAGDHFIHTLADLIKIFIFVVIPMLLLAAWVEANITPQVVLWFYGS
jgi:uncharacterized membrane protein SpoIIM required for sporulation/ABC-type transport system involved in multi-copper enzyme maturation permease subunit